MSVQCDFFKFVFFYLQLFCFSIRQINDQPVFIPHDQHEITSVNNNERQLCNKFSFCQKNNLPQTRLKIDVNCKGQNDTTIRHMSITFYTGNSVMPRIGILQPIYTHRKAIIQFYSQQLRYTTMTQCFCVSITGKSTDVYNWFSWKIQLQGPIFTVISWKFAMPELTCIEWQSLH